MVTEDAEIIIIFSLNLPVAATALIILSVPTSLGLSHFIFKPVFTPADITMGLLPIISLEITS